MFYLPKPGTGFVVCLTEDKGIRNNRDFYGCLFFFLFFGDFFFLIVVDLQYCVNFCAAK